MKGIAKPLAQLIEGNKNQLVIPVYQRNYDWLTVNCKQLFIDIVKLSNQEKVEQHFFGSIVMACPDCGYNKLIIDGQQRITSISLLLLAAIRAVKDKVMHSSSASLLEQALETYLLAKYCESERKIKLVPIIKDRIVYDNVFDLCINDAQVELDEFSKITINFRYFYSCIEKAKEHLSFDKLLKAIDSLNVVSVDLDRDDDAQLIFESLNSTGLDLTEADKIRNYMFMSLTKEEQRQCFKEYWQKIEIATDKHPNKFLSDYLNIHSTCFGNGLLRQRDIYVEWKNYMEGKDRKAEFQKMLHFVRYYQQYTDARMATPKLSKKMANIGKLETSVASSFFTEFLEYADQKSFAEDEILKVISCIECYLVRRAACRKFSEGLSRVFNSLHKEVLKLLNTQSDASYSDVLSYSLLSREGRTSWPRDNDFYTSLKSNDAYGLSKPALFLLLECLENYSNEEYNDVSNELKNKISKVERIMPKNLSDNWKAMLGANHKQIHSQYLNALANLVPVKSGSKLEKKDFAIKCFGENKSDYCYSNSKYRITRAVAQNQQLTLTELELRSDWAANTLMKIFPLPQTNFKPLPKAADEVSLDNENLSIRNRTLQSYRLFGQEFQEKNWKEFLIAVIKQLSDMFPDDIDALYNNTHYMERYCPDNSWRYTEIAPSKFVKTAIDSPSKLRLLRMIFDKCGVDQAELVMVLKPLKDQVD